MSPENAQLMLRLVPIFWILGFLAFLSIPIALFMI